MEIEIEMLYLSFAVSRRTVGFDVMEGCKQRPQ